MIRALAALWLAIPASASAQSPSSVAAPAQAGDDAAIDALVRDIYAVISGPAGPRDWDRFRALFVSEGRLVPVGDRGPTILTVDGFIERAGTSMAKDGFYEREVSRRIERYGNVAYVFSTYDSRRTHDGAPFARGINSIQLVRVAGVWRVLQIAWQGETPAFPIPAPYLAKAAPR